MIFAREINDHLTSLVKKVDAINKDQGKKMGSFVVILGDEEGTEKKLKDLAEKQKLEKTILTTFAKQDGPENYEIAKDADVTVICYKSKTVKTNRAFKKGEFKAADVDKIIKEDLSKIIDSGK